MWVLEVMEFKGGLVVGGNGSGPDCWGRKKMITKKKYYSFKGERK